MIRPARFLKFDYKLFEQTYTTSKELKLYNNKNFLLLYNYHEGDSSSHVYHSFEWLQFPSMFLQQEPKSIYQPIWTLLPPQYWSASLRLIYSCLLNILTRWLRTPSYYQKSYYKRYLGHVCCTSYSLLFHSVFLIFTNDHTFLFISLSITKQWEC